MCGMDENRVALDRLELKQKFYLSLTIAMARASSIRRDLLNPRTTEKAEGSRDFAAERLADHLTNDFFISGHEVTRNACGSDDVEAMMHRIRVRADERNRGGDGGREPDAPDA